ncbi:TPA: hypothetical protein ACNU3X_004781 [Citrobacter farmeri]
MALTLLAANNAQTVLAAGINATATTLTVNTGTGNLFPSPVSGTSFFKLTLVDSATGSLSEIVHVTSRTGDTMTIEREQEGTTARIWSANDIAANMLTAGSLQLYAQKDQSLLIANNLSEIANAGPDAVAQTLSNLQLGEAAKRNVGTGANQIPDMNSFLCSLASNGYMKFPGGIIVQWANAGPLVGNSSALLSFPIPFPNQLLVAVPYTGSTVAAQNLGVSVKYETRQSVTLFASTTSTSTSCGAISIGY